MANHRQTEGIAELTGDEVITSHPVLSPESAPTERTTTASSPPKYQDDPEVVPPSMPPNHQDDLEVVPLTVPPPAYTARDENAKPAENSASAQTITPLDKLTAEPAYIDCPYCKKVSITVVERKGGGTQCIVACCCFLILPPCICLPYIGGWFEDKYIYCGRCQKGIAMIAHGGQIDVLAPQPRKQVVAQYSGPSQMSPGQQ